jgi:tRNA (cmo5U34)-methyltransferase
MRDISSLKHRPPSRWVFDESVVQCFDDMLTRSIPEYESMRRAVTEVARHYMRPDHWIVDLGCSKGEAMAPLFAEFGKTNQFLGVESAEAMLCAARNRFAAAIQAGRVVISDMDLRTKYPDVQACVTLSVLTLQFVPIERRQTLVTSAFDHTAPGGALILVEKVLGASAKLDAMMVASYYRLKRRNGYEPEEIDCKRHRRMERKRAGNGGL